MKKQIVTTLFSPSTIQKIFVSSAVTIISRLNLSVCYYFASLITGQITFVALGILMLFALLQCIKKFVANSKTQKLELVKSILLVQECCKITTRLNKLASKKIDSSKDNFEKTGEELDRDVLLMIADIKSLEYILHK